MRKKDFVKRERNLLEKQREGYTENENPRDPEPEEKRWREVLEAEID